MTRLNYYIQFDEIYLTGLARLPVRLFSPIGCPHTPRGFAFPSGSSAMQRRRELIRDSAHDFAPRILSRSTTRLHRRNQRLDAAPLLLGQIGRVRLTFFHSF